MIGWLSGEVRYVDGSTVTLDVGGVGYEISVPARIVAACPVGSSLELVVRTIVRDDAIVLYGFSTVEDRRVFDLLLATPGVGPSTAIGALSALSADDLARAVATEDVAVLSSVPGIGKKTASRLVLELSGKLPNLDVSPVTTSDVASDVTVALRQLGYSAQEIKEALRDVDLPGDDEAALRLVLSRLATT